MQSKTKLKFLLFELSITEETPARADLTPHPHPCNPDLPGPQESPTLVCMTDPKSFLGSLLPVPRLWTVSAISCNDLTLSSYRYPMLLVNMISPDLDG